MLVDARWPPSEPEPERPQIPWALLIWPALTVAFLVLGHHVPPLGVFACVIAALYCAVETFLRIVPLTTGMREYRQ